MIQQGVVSEVDDDAIDIQFPPSCAFQQQEVSRADNREKIKTELELFTGVMRNLHLTVTDEEPVAVATIPQSNSIPEESSAQNENDQAEQNTPAPFSHHSAVVEDEIRKEPIIATLLEKFNAEIL